MKVKNFLKSFSYLFLSFLLILLSGVPVSAEVKLPSGREEEFAENNLVFYNPDGSLEDCTEGGATAVEGNTLRDKVWNYLISKNIKGVSDNPAVLAGILGNLQGESGFNPFILNNAGYFGVAQFNQDGYSDLKAELEREGLWQYMTIDKNKKVEDSKVDRALQIELDYLTEKASRFKNFVKNLDVPTNKTGIEGAQSYAELFLVDFEGAVETSKHPGTPLIDPGVKAHTRYPRWQGVSDRRKNAADIYKALGSSGASATASSPSASAGGSSDGSNVLIIGDSITVKSENDIKALLPKAKILARSGRTFQQGIDILNEQKNIPKILVFALGANSSNVSESQINEVLNKAGNNRTVIFTTNYSKGRINYTHNNNLFKTTASKHNNVLVADWNKAVGSNGDKYISTDPDGVDVHPKTGEGTKLFAKTIADKIGGTGDSGTQWSNGWIKSGTFSGYTKEVPPSGWSDDTENRQFSTPGKKPNKILLHSTEGTTSGLAAYPKGNHFAPHFTIDLVKKRVSQHYSIKVASTAIKSHDTDGAIQIEIVGFSKPGEKFKDSEYVLSKFGNDEWDYLAALLIAISEQTGIPLTTSVNWEKPQRLSASAFKNYSGILGHMHAADNDHVDPGNIWPQLSKAIKRNPRAGGNSSTNYCSNNVKSAGGNSTGSGKLVSGGMTLSQAQSFMEAYAKESDKMARGNVVFQGATITRGECPSGTMNNCSAFTQWFLNRYTSMGPSGAILRQGSQAVKTYLKANPKLIDGGKVPKAYAVMSMGPQTNSREGWPNHTGIVLGIDKDKDQIIIGEASCGSNNGRRGYRPRAKAYSLSKYTNSPSQYGPTYAYTDNILKSGELK